MSKRRVESLRAARVVLIDVVKRAEELARSVPEIEAALRGAEATIVAGARERILMLHHEANERLALLRHHQGEASRLLRDLSTAKEGPWRELEEAVDLALTNARTVLDSILERLRRAAARGG